MLNEPILLLINCHVIVRNRLSLSMGSQGVAAGAKTTVVSGQGQGTPWTSHQLIAGPHWWAMWGSVSRARTLRHAAQPCPELGFEPATLRSLVDLLYSLSYSRPTKCKLLFAKFVHKFLKFTKLYVTIYIQMQAMLRSAWAPSS